MVFFSLRILGGLTDIYEFLPSPAAVIHNYTPIREVDVWENYRSFAIILFLHNT